MNTPSSIPAGWYPDPDTGGAKYWDGQRWTGHSKSPAKQKFSGRSLGILLGVLGALFLFSCLSAFVEEPQSDETSGSTLLTMLVLGLLMLPIGIYFLRGKGRLAEAVDEHFAAKHRGKELEKRNAELEVQRVQHKAELEEQRKRQNREELRKAVVGRIAPSKRNDATVAAQINALANPETATALQNLQNLLYTQAITEDEYQAAKNKLLGPA